ncbi:MAG: hypothetical protein HY865_05170 [Chloroflexi bacterium]|nr:hypothetical protein [Chloroflexota bacterium]
MKTMKRAVGDFPDFGSVRNIYAVIVFMVYSWTLLTSFYNLPSWMFYLTVGQILSMYAYAFLMNLAESLCLLFAVIFLEITLFRMLKNREGFQVRSILLVLIVFTSITFRLILFKTSGETEMFSSGQELTWWLLVLVPSLLLVVFLPKINLIRGFLEAIAERALVFLYIYLPLSFVSIIIVIARNLL